MKVTLTALAGQRTKMTSWVIMYDASTEKVLLLKRAKNTNNPKLWNFPGGGIDKGTTPVQGAKRELFEEAGVKAKKSDLEFLGQIKDEFYYLLILKSTPTLRVDPAESSDYEWVPFKEVKEKKLHKKTKNLLEDKGLRRLASLLMRRSAPD